MSTNSNSNNIKIHTNIIKKLDDYIINNKIPNIIFHGPNGSGKKYILNNFINKLYQNNRESIKMFVMYVNCAHGKGIKFIREDLKLFSKTNVLNESGVNFKTVILYNADKLTIDAQSALRRCIELFSHSTRFFIIIENKYKLLRPILSRFCDIYISLPIIKNVHTNLYSYNIKKSGPFYKNKINHNNKFQKLINKNDILENQLISTSNEIYEKGYSAINLIDFLKNPNNCKHINSLEKNEIIITFYKIKREFRCEKMLILIILNFIFFRNNYCLENISFI